MRVGGAGDFRPLRRLVSRVLVEIDLAQNRHRVALEQMRDHFALESGLAAHDEIAHRDFRRAGNERDRGFFQLHDFRGRGGAFLCASPARPPAAWRRRARAALSAVGEVTGEGIAGSEFVLFCATATVATISPRVNQQCFFINPKVKF